MRRTDSSATSGLATRMPSAPRPHARGRRARRGTGMAGQAHADERAPHQPRSRCRSVRPPVRAPLGRVLGMFSYPWWRATSSTTSVSMVTSGREAGRGDDQCAVAVRLHLEADRSQVPGDVLGRQVGAEQPVHPGGPHPMRCAFRGSHPPRRSDPGCRRRGTPQSVHSQMDPPRVGPPLEPTEASVRSPSRRAVREIGKRGTTPPPAGRRWSSRRSQSRRPP